MDIFAVYECDKHDVISKIRQIGIRSIYNSNVKAAGVTWFEEEGIYIRHARLVVALVDEKMLADECDGYCINTAFNRGKTVYALIQGGEEVADRFAKRWPGAVLFYDANKLINAIVELQLGERTLSGLSIKANMYFRAFMLEEALDAASELIDAGRTELDAAVGYLDTEAREVICDAYELCAMIRFIRGEHSEFEAAIGEAISICRGSRVIWASDSELYYANILIHHYTEIAPDAERAGELRLRYFGKKCFGFGAAEEEKNTERMHQRVSLFFEKGYRLKDKQRDEGRAEVKPEGGIHKAIAEHIRATILLFNQLGGEEVRIGFGECLRTGYERLAEYCRIIGEKELAVECMDMIAANLGRLVVEDSVTDESLVNLKCIKAYLGEKQPDSGFFDVFISHRSADTEMAASVYTHLKAKGKSPFLDRVCLPVLGDSEYRNSILDAIDKSAHFVLVSSDLKFLESRWVSEECNLFCDEKREGRKNGNFIMVFPREVCAEIFATNKRCLPIQLRSFEIVAFEDFEATLMNYII